MTSLSSPPSTAPSAGRPASARARALSVLALRSAYRALSDFGWMWIGMWGGPVPPEEPGPVLQGPPPGHPERLCHDRPLTAVERALNRQLLA